MPSLSPSELAGWVRARAEGRRRYVFGVAGPPGAGKSTIADRLGRELDAPVVPMDGFHRSNAVLREHGLVDVKGAPETFDAVAFVALVRDLSRAVRTVSAPVFDRTIDEPIEDGIRIGVDERIVVVEGNYLLLDEPPWSGLRDLFDDVAYVDLDDDVRTERLVARHVAHGKTPEHARRFVGASDGANARRVTAARHRAAITIVAN